ncbi:hypothetical protein QNM97_17855 [Gordonia sp. L191]|uniref:hypothetical protein n=1 Tax=Gordonia sp. L191 TaxID=2982699 RepID=UPI0024C00188|nr:hypothetical protein [Gordonia sp. L191]WHU45859.1 hypothetical protein QNM97_17855 [Gordonia sp. L191]
MTEYFVQPGTRVPLGGESTTPPDTSVPRGNPELGDGGVVQVIDAEWKRRAGVARNLAAELAGVVAELVRVNNGNHYGNVPEGTNMSERAAEFVNCFAAGLKANIKRLDALEALCDQAHAELTATDGKNGQVFESINA